ncbi:MAG: ATP synthase F1 subunit delta [Filifactoraceae bacterium]
MAELVQERYARSLFDVAVETKCQEQIMEQLNFIYKIIQDKPEFLKLLSAKTMGKHEIKEVISSVFEGKLSEFIINMMKIMVDNKRISLISKVCESYKSIYYDYNNMLEVTVTTAFILSDFHRERLCKKLKELTGKEAIIKNVVNEKILGGVILNVGNEQIDNSVNGKLEELKKQLATLTI